MRRSSLGFLPVFFVFLLFIHFVFAGGAYAGDQKNFLWKIRSKTDTLYILGSIHFLKKDIYPLNKKIEEAFERSDNLVIEANIDDAGQIDIEKLIGKAIYQDGDTLENHISMQTYDLLKQELDRSGLPIELVNKQRPWFLALTLTSLELVKLGYDPASGIDMHFISEASGRKKILELESLDYQLNLFSAFSDREQEAFLLYTLKDLHTLGSEADSLVRAWMSGNARGVESILSKGVSGDAGMSSVYEKLLYERNRNMASKIEGFLKTGETYFIVVGAGHLVGNRGIIKILKEKGYIVEQL
jgi:uncharacterized protein YbaP (TraB family)